MSPACVVQSPADKADIVGGTAAATGLSDNQGNVIQIVFSAFKSRNHLTGYKN